MALNKFKKIKLDTIQLQKFQDNTKSVLDSVTSNPLLDGVLITDLQLLSGTTNVINHKLGRMPLGWIITRKRSQADIWDLQDLNSTKINTLNLACSSDVKIDIWIF